MALLSLLLLLPLLTSPAHSLTSAPVTALHLASPFPNLTNGSDASHVAPDDDDDDDLLERETGMDRRSLYWRRHYYISYGALAANRIPCPARSGRSYYTRNCYKARGPANPYTRGCSAITRCRR